MELGRLTKKQYDILIFIYDYCKENLCSPTAKEISLSFGFRSYNAAAEHVNLIRKKGYLRDDIDSGRIALTKIAMNKRRWKMRDGA